MVGIAVHEKDACAARMRVRDLNLASGPSATSAAPEFHAVDIWNNRRFFAKHANSISLSAKLGLFGKMADIVSRPEVSIIDVIVDKTRYGGRNSEYILRMAWSALFDRFFFFLDELPGGPEWGVIIADRNDAGTQSLIADVVSKKSKKLRARRPRYVGVVDDVHFRRSDDEEGIQMADGAAFMIRKHLREEGTFRCEYAKLLSRHVPRHSEQRSRRT